MSDPLPPNDNPFAGPPVGSTPTSPTEAGPLPGSEPPSDPPPPDPGSKNARTIAWIAIAVLLPIVVALQQLQATFAPPTVVDQTAEISPPSALDPFTSSAKPILKLRHFLDGQGSTPGMMDMAAESLTDAAFTPADKVRLAITQWELGHPDDAQQTLDDLADSLEPDASILPDIKLVTDLIAGESLATQEEQDDLIAHHGWFAELALSHDDEARHNELLDGGLAMVVIFSLIGLGILGALIAGIVLLIVGFIKINAGTMPRRFVAPSSGGSVYLEMLPLFIGGFLVLQLLAAYFVFALGEETGMIASLASQWLLLGIIGWPLVRGVPWSRVKQDLGLYAPNGILREIGAGVLFYIASLPIYFFVAFIVAILFLILEALKSGGQAGGSPPPSNPVVDLVANASPLMLIMFALLATVWAPLMEELIFRGGVFRHLRSKLHWIPAALIVAFAFGVMHQYHPLQLIPVMTLGVIFGVMREWRGSIIPAMTAHFIHNFVVFALLTVVLGYAMN